jgi:hypothetical protein
MRNTVIRLLFLVLTATGLDAADIAVDFKKAMADDDSVAKKEAVAATVALMDDDALPLLVSAVDDRQSHDAVVVALRSRTGLAPTARSRSGGYPGYPPADTGAAWAQWLSARAKVKETEKKLADEDKKLKELSAAITAIKKKDQDGKDVANGADAPSTDTAAEKPKIAIEPPADLGRPNRILFKNGGSLVCYILSKRTDANGVLQAVRIVHLDDGGEEILAADLIARIEEYFR